MAGKRNLGNVEIIRNAPVRTRAHYDPYITVNTIDRRVLNGVEVARYGTRLPGNALEMEGSSLAIIQCPWRHGEFYPAHAYVHLKVRIRRTFIARRVRFYVVENCLNQIVLGAEFAKKYFLRVSDNNCSISRRWN